jgi:hypothetical protein
VYGRTHAGLTRTALAAGEQNLQAGARLRPLLLLTPTNVDDLPGMSSRDYFLSMRVIYNGERRWKPAATTSELIREAWSKAVGVH